MNVFLTNVDRLLYEQGRKRPWLSSQSQVGLSTINNWFAYDRFPSVDHAHMVAVALGTDVSTLMGTPPKGAAPEGRRGALWLAMCDVPEHEIGMATELVRVFIKGVELERGMAAAMRRLDPNAGV